MTESLEWLRLDERTNAIDNLEMCSYFLRNLPEPRRWKWAIIAIHQALYGFAVAAVQGTNSSSVLKTPSDPRSPLISVWEALRRVKDPKHLWPGTVALVTSPEEDRAIDRVATEFRNAFEHFAPSSWSIEVAGLPTLLGHVLRVIHGIAMGAESRHVFQAEDLKRLRAGLAATASDLGVLLPAA